jgi:hypothetical protein
VKARKEGNGSCDANANAVHQDRRVLPSVRGFSVMGVTFKLS